MPLNSLAVLQSIPRDIVHAGQLEWCIICVPPMHTPVHPPCLLPFRLAYLELPELLVEITLGAGAQHIGIIKVVTTADEISDNKGQ